MTRVTDERLAEIWKIYNAMEIHQSSQLIGELLQALKAERKRNEELEVELKQQRLLVYSATGGCSYQRLAKALERVREMENYNLIPKE